MTGERSDLRLLAMGINLLADATTARVVAGFRSAGIDSVLLKGRANRGWLDDNSERFSNDVDLLVDPGRLDEAERVLASLGFVRQGSLDVLPGDRPYHASNWATRDGVEIDLHRYLVGVRLPAAAAWPILAAATEEIQIGDERVTVLSPTARALHLALHAAQHGVRETRTIEDLELGLEVLPTALWADVAELAKRLDAEAALLVGLRLTARGRLFADQLELPDDVPLDVALRASSPPPMTAGFEWLSTMRGSRERATFVLRKIVPPPEWMRAWKPVARRGNGGLLVAYLWRPVWLVTNAVPAYRAWRRLRKGRRL